MVIKGVNKVNRFTACHLAAKLARATFVLVRVEKDLTVAGHVRRSTKAAVRELTK